MNTARAREAEPRIGWPRVCRPSPRYTLLGWVLFVGSGAAGVFAASALRAGQALAAVLTALFFCSLGALILVMVRVERIVLHEDGTLDVRRLGRGSRRIRRQEVAGLRRLGRQYGIDSYALELRAPGRKRIAFATMCEHDDALREWLAGLPDLDAADLARSAESPVLGRTAQERRTALAKAHRVARALNGAAVGLTTWALIAPIPYALVIAANAALPLVALAMMLAQPGRYSVEGRRNDAAAGITFAWLLPGLVLSFRAARNVTVIDYPLLLEWTAAAALLLTVFLAVAEPVLRRRRLSLVALMLVLAVPYAWGGATHADTLLDGADARVFRVAVISKQMSAGKYPVPQLTLAPWGPFDRPETVTVSRPLYIAVDPGDTPCVRMYPGWLGVRWYVVDGCPPDSGP